MKQLWLTPEEILAHTESVWGDKERLKKYAALETRRAAVTRR